MPCQRLTRSEKDGHEPEQAVHAQKSYNHPDIRFGHRYADILGTSAGSMRPLRGRLPHSCHVNIVWETLRERAK
jgi:hypothetical protein